MSDTKTSTTKLKKRLVILQKSGTVVMQNVLRVHRSLYVHLGKVYIWWRDAMELGDYLQSEYDSLGLKFKYKIKSGINFGPLLVLAYGFNAIDKDRKYIYSIVLNDVHREFERNPNTYETNGANKLANFIGQSGGVKAITVNATNKDYDLDELDDDDDLDAAADDLQEDLVVVVENAVDYKKSRRDVLLELANELDVHGEEDTVKLPAYIINNPREFGIMLIQYKSDGSYTPIDIQNEKTIIDDMLVNNMGKRFEVAAQSVRPLFEIIKTQCLPDVVADYAEKLIDKTTIKEEGKRKKAFTSHRRVMYRHETNEFILSPINALSGVVSIIKPFFDQVVADSVFENCETDVYLSIETREEIEEVLLRNFEFNLYSVEHKTLPIPQYPELNSALYVVHLRHRVKPNIFLNIPFFPFYRSNGESQDQLVIDLDYVFTPTWHAHYARDEIKRVYCVFIDNWLKLGHSKYLPRPSHETLRVTFSKSNWKIEFVYKEDDYTKYNTNNVAINAIEVSDEAVTAIFRTKDFMPALVSLADLPITKVAEEYNIDGFEDAFVPEEVANYKGGVIFELNDDMLCIKFSTYTYGGSEHTIYIPTLNAERKPATAPFKRYFPKLVEEDTITDEGELYE
jgi:hypothetical protein